MTRIYELSPIQALYSTVERDRLYDTLRRVVESTPSDAYMKIFIIRERARIPITEEEKMRVNVYRTIIEAVNIPPVVEYTILESVPVPRIVRTYADYVELYNGKLATTLVIVDVRYEMSEYALLVEALSRIGDLESFSHIAILIRNVGRKIFKYLESARERFSYRRSQESKLYVERESQLIEEGFLAVTQGDTILMTVPVIVLADYDIKTLEEDVKYVKNELETRGFTIWRPRYLHDIFYSLDVLKIRRGLYLTATSFVRVFTPAVSHRVVEEDGILVGLAVPTREPVIFNPFVHTNPHILIAGRTGSGKSFFTKCFIRRLVAKYGSNVEVYVIDPEGEYSRIAGPKGLLEQFYTMRLDLVRGCGLDPVKTYLHAVEEEERDRALALIVNLLRELYNIPDIYENELFEAVEKSESIFEIPEKVRSLELRRRLERMYKPPDSKVFSGDPIVVNYPLTIIDLSDVRSCVDDRTLSIVCTLLTAYLRARLVARSGGSYRFLIVDEGWLLFKHRSTAWFIEEAARTFRKRRTSLIFITQSLDDVVKFTEAEPILQNVATYILFNHETTSRAAHCLSSEELDMLRSLGIGFYLLKTDRYVLLTYNEPTRIELEKIR
ncbi:MAG: DUF87 domain-containing protein [Crenarchaeota archaeon]|nr:DUF87 domain-containing protein [Thermoproteota archaeon]